MLDNRVGSVVVTDDGNPTGIVTETDVLLTGYRTGDAFEEIDLGRAMSSPLVTVTGDTTVRRAVERMRDREIKKLPVIDGLDVVGIPTLTDIAHSHEEFLDEARRIEAARVEWKPSADDHGSR
jgi:CBS domain-containing protein